MNERWVEIPGAASYEISSLGRVRRKAGTYRCKDGRLLKLKIDKHGYVKVSLSMGQRGQYRHAQVHRLMAEAFLGPAPSEEMQAAHWDGVRHHNTLGNIRWATPVENAADRARHGRSRGAKRGVAHHRAILTPERVIKMRQMKSDGDRLEDIAEKFGVGRITAYNAIKGTTWGHVLAGL